MLGWNSNKWGYIIIGDRWLLGCEFKQNDCLCMNPSTPLSSLFIFLLSPFPLFATKKMAFAGTTQKCNACDKTVYLVDKLTADNRIFHKACFRCHHCNGTLKVFFLFIFRSAHNLFDLMPQSTFTNLFVVIFSA